MNAVQQWQQILWDARREQARLAFDMVNQAGVNIRWISGFAILAIFYAIVNRNVIQAALSICHPIFWAIFLLIVCSVSSAIVLVIIHKLRAYEMESLANDFLKLQNFTFAFLSNNPPTEPLTFVRQEKYFILNRCAWYIGYAIPVTFFGALILGAIGLFVGWKTI